MCKPRCLPCPTCRTSWPFSFAPLVLALTACLSTPGSAQTLAEYQTAMNMQNTLSGASMGPTGGGYYGGAGYGAPSGMTVPVPGTYGAGYGAGGYGAPSPYGMGASPYGAAGYPYGGGMPYGGEGGAGFPGMPPYGMPGAGYGMPGLPYGVPGVMGPGGMPLPTAPAAVATTVPQILALTGQRVTCRVTGELLEDIHFEYRPETDKDNFYDDGTHGDLMANDNIWTNMGERNDVLSATANYLKQIYLNLLRMSEDTNPLEFFGIPVATEEPLSTLPRMSDQERERDETFLRPWHNKFLALYREDPEDPQSAFLSIFIPSPPRKPDTTPPPDNDFHTNAFALDSYIQRTVEGALIPAVAAPMMRTGGVVRYGGASAGGSFASESPQGYQGAGGGSRWGMLRQDARNLAGGGYFGR